MLLTFILLESTGVFKFPFLSLLVDNEFIDDKTATLRFFACAYIVRALSTLTMRMFTIFSVFAVRHFCQSRILSFLIVINL